MKRKKRIILLLFWTCISASMAQEQTHTGWITVLWGDQQPDLEWSPAPKIMLTNDSVALELVIDAPFLESLGGLQAIHETYAQVSGMTDFRDNGVDRLWVQALLIQRTSDTFRAVSGSQPWITLPMKFSDVPQEQKNQAYFQGMYSNLPGGLDHFWREVSYNHIDIVGSLSVDWYTLPHTHSYYVPNPGSGTDADLYALFDDTIATVDPDIDFSDSGSGPYAGISMMFNELLDCCAWGGSRWASIDGVAKIWRVTWEPPWAFNNEAVVAHEMGHGFGLPHANNFDGDNDPYDNPWDVMSHNWSYAVENPTYGKLGKHVCAYHKEILGWYHQENFIEITEDGYYQVTIDHAALASTSNYFAVKIPYGSQGHYYTLETRKKEGNYDANLPADAVLIYQVEPQRDEPAWLVDEDNPPADFADNAGSHWVVGETYTDDTNGIVISVLQETVNGFVVAIQIGSCDPSSFMNNLENWPSTKITELLTLLCL
ncbi:MAG: hypothetical protein CSA81_08280 [Acidobacteria bacterium]|nr:MAG: hypothetical protein CSA81_08280 [Acidobacteriota bacterium]PIE89721.1 MAG: hypothetical protein CR997_09815 [Acidobacteriota bacterium]